MLCKKCGRQNPEYSNFCGRCGYNFSNPPLNLSQVNRNFTNQISNVPNQATTNKTNHVLIPLIIAFSIIVFEYIIVINSLIYGIDNIDPAFNASVIVANNSSQQSVNKNLVNGFAKIAEGYIADYLTDSANAKIDYGNSALEFHNAYCISKGAISFKDLYGVQVMRPYEVGMYCNLETVYVVYIKLGSDTLIDERGSLDKDGLFIKSFIYEKNYYSKGKPILKNLVNVAGLIGARNIHDGILLNNQNTSITASTYDKIQENMSYEDVTKIIGSCGTMKSIVTIKDCYTVVWLGDTNAMVEINFKNDLVQNKFSKGLK